MTATEQQPTGVPVPTSLPDSVETFIMGAGFAGLCAAIKLDEAGFGDYVIADRGNDVGGTWRDNTYPGCACDVPSHLYSYSFAPLPSWEHAFSRQPQILAYLQGIARDYRLTDRLALDTEVTDARWDDTTQRWTVVTSRGTVIARYLIGAQGPLSEPKVPSLPGLDTFEGTTFHSAAWNHDHDLHGKRVAVVGTGASAIQFIPYVQPEASHLTVFQRTAPWVLPRADRPYRAWEKRLNKVVPGVQRAIRSRIWAVRESTAVGFVKAPGMLAVAERAGRRLLAKQVPDPDLRATLTPHFRLGCKRVLLSNTYYPALSQPNVDVVTDGIVEVTPHGIVTAAADGTRTEHEVDTIIFGTGFHVTDPPSAKRLHAADGHSLAQDWDAHGMAALHGLAISGFPNLFMLVGPNTGLGHTSIVLMIEAQVGYLVDLLQQMSARGIGAVAPRPEAEAAYNDRLQQLLEGTVWSVGGCQSWYLDRNGRNTTLWPTFTFSFIRELRHADLGEYEQVPVTAAAPTATRQEPVRT